MKSLLALSAILLLTTGAAVDAQHHTPQEVIRHHIQSFKGAKKLVLATIEAAKQDAQANLNGEANPNDHGFNEQMTHVQDTSANCSAILSNQSTWFWRSCYLNARPANPLSGDYPTQAERDAVIASYPTTECYQSIMHILKNESCYSWNTLRNALMHRYMFTQTGTDGKTCVHTYSKFQAMFSCDGYNATTCTSAGSLCRARPTDTLGGVNETGGVDHHNPAEVCQPSFNDTALDEICTGCLTGFANAFKSRQKYDLFLRSFGRIDQLLCSMKAADGARCYPKIIAASDAHMDQPFSSQAGADAVCGDRNVLGCYKRIIGSSVSNEIQQAKQYFRDTWTLLYKQYGYNASAYGFKANVAALEEIFRITMANAKRNGNQMRNLCIKNGAGKSCSYLYDKLGRAGEGGCLFKAMNSMDCTSCKDSLQTVWDEMGCCAGSIQETLAAPYYLTAKDWPVFENFTNPGNDTVAQIATTEPLALAGNQVATMYSDDSNLTKVAACGVTGVANAVRAKCAPFTGRVRKALRMKIKFSSLTEAKKTALQAALKSDMAANLGLTEDEIINDQLVADDSLTVEQRAFSVQSNAGTKYEFDIAAEDEASSDAANSSFDELDASNGFDLTNAEAETDSEITTETSPTPAPSGAVGTSAALAGVLAMISMVLFF